MNLSSPSIIYTFPNLQLQLPKGELLHPDAYEEHGNSPLIGRDTTATTRDGNNQFNQVLGHSLH